jgi:basic amino acid/polyamine antiporter, APA family
VIVDESRQVGVKAIVLPLPARSGGTVFGKTVETVLAERPCRVIIQADPQGVASARVPARSAA